MAIVPCSRGGSLLRFLVRVAVLGFGLPLARLYAQYFGGDIEVYMLG